MAFIPDRNLSIFYNISILLPMVLLLTLHGENTGLILAIVFYCVYLILVSIKANDEYWSALENESLLEKKTEELRQQNRIDPLTNLYNRRHFDQIFELNLGLCIRNSTPISLIICDIDHFKNINDQYGHPTGDEYLKLFSKCLQKVFKRKTDMIGRYGGEEFVILLPDADRATAIAMAESLRALVAMTPLQFEHSAIQSTTSLGLTHCIPDQGIAAKDLFRVADKALYCAKNTGRNRLVVIDTKTNAPNNPSEYSDLPPYHP